MRARATSSRPRSTDLFAHVETEPGTEVYVLNRSAADPDSFFFFELYVDGDALTAHGGSDAMKAAGASVRSADQGQRAARRRTDQGNRARDLGATHSQAHASLLGQPLHG